MSGKDGWMDAQLRKAMKQADTIAGAEDHTYPERAAALLRIGKYFTARAQAIPPDPFVLDEDDEE